APRVWGEAPPRAPKPTPNNKKKKHRRGQPEDQMARHGRPPFAPDRCAVDAGNDVDRKPLELAMTAPPFDRVDLGPPDGLDAALPSLRDRRVQSAAGLETLVGPLRITGKKSAVCTQQRVKASRAAADERIELLEILRQH